jgi:hypothetical protein
VLAARRLAGAQLGGDVARRAIASIYRQLGKVQEDTRDQLRAADFHYGEMEMRRYSRPATRSGAQHK